LGAASNGYRVRILDWSVGIYRNQQAFDSGSGRGVRRYSRWHPLPGQIVGMAGKADMALLKTDTDKKLPAVPFGDSNAVNVGDTVIALGSPFGFDDSVTAGIVSAVDRDIMESPFDDYIQTDAIPAARCSMRRER
jgi:S1-C subfamily serine protease